MIKKENTRSSIISLALIVLLLLCVAEIVLGLLAQFHPPFKQWLGQGGETFTISPKVIKDEKLGHKLAPNSFEVDTRGFRNPSAPSGFDQSDIVVLGDQLVYGQGIEFS